MTATAASNRSFCITLAIGIVLGVLGTVYLPRYVRPYLPASIAGKETVVTGTVAAKQRKEQSLLLTVNTPQGAVLITVTKNVDEVDLLVGENNTVEFALRTYSPFVENPRITRVLKEAPSLSPEPPTVPQAPGPKDMKKSPSAPAAPQGAPGKRQQSAGESSHPDSAGTGTGK
jgi:small basic protein